MEEYRAALEAQLAAERALGRSRGEPVCVPVDWRPAWDIGAPCPHVVSSGGRTFLIYLANETETRGVGAFTSARMIQPASEQPELLALIELKGCYGHRFGGPNDEVISGHPFYGRGLRAYRAHIIENSPWLATERKTNSVHRGFRADRWERINHYLLCFHDDTFEFLAEGWAAEVIAASFPQVVGLAVERMFASP
jgi:hypothetical protein